MKYVRKIKRKPESLKRAASGTKEVGGNRNTRISNIGKKHSERELELSLKDYIYLLYY